MKLTRSTILELGQVLKDEYNQEFEYKDLEKFAYSLVGYFDLMQKILNRHKFGNSPVRVIDSENKDGLDKREERN